MPTLIALNDSTPAWAAFDYALEHHTPEDLVLVHVVTPSADAETPTEQLFTRAAERAYVAPARFQTDVRAGDPVPELLTAAEDHDATQIIVGSHGREGVPRVVLGSVAEELVRRSPIPVTVVR